MNTPRTVTVAKLRDHPNSAVALGAFVASVAGLVSTPEPTGGTVTDAVWTVLAASLASMIAGRAVKAWRPKMTRDRRALVAASLVAVMFYVRVPGPMGAEVWVSAAVLLALAVYGEVRKPARRRRRRWRRRTRMRVGLLAVTSTLVMGIGFGVSQAASNEVRGTLATPFGFGVQAAGNLRTLNFDLARDKFDQVADALDRYEAAVGGWRGILMGLMPVVGHQRRYVQDGITRLRQMSARVTELVEIGPRARLSLRAGAVNLTGVESLEEPLARLAESVRALRQSVDGASPWVSGELKDAFTGLVEAVATYAGSLETMMRVVALMPGALGGGAEPRTYVVQVVTHEGVGAGGGVPVATGVVTADNGSVTARFFDGSRPGVPGGPGGSGGSGDAGGPGGSSGSAGGFDVNEPDFAVAAARAHGDFERTVGGPIAGIFHVDVTALATMLEALGGLDVGGPDGVVKVYSDTLVKELRADDGGFRGVTARNVAAAIARRLLTLDEVELAVVAEVWADAVENGNLKMWFADKDGASLASAIVADGSMGEPASTLDVAVVTSDVGGEFGSAWLVRREMNYNATVSDSGRANSMLTVKLVNNGAQTRRLVTTAYSPLECAAGDLRTTVKNVGQTDGWTKYSMMATVGARSSETVRLSCAGATVGSGANGSSIAPRIRGQVIAGEDRWSVRVSVPRKMVQAELVGGNEREKVPATAPATVFEMDRTLSRNGWTEVPELSK